jgi:hypothetical protein
LSGGNVCRQDGLFFSVQSRWLCGKAHMHILSFVYYLLQFRA